MRNSIKQSEPRLSARGFPYIDAIVVFVFFIEQQGQEKNKPRHGASECQAATDDEKQTNMAQEEKAGAGVSVS